MRTFLVTDVVRDYAVGHDSWVPDDVVRQLRSETQALDDVAGMQIGDDQGQLLTMLARLVGARRAVEVGTFTGYSSLCIARGLDEGGSLLCCDVSEEWTAIGVRAWERAGLSDRIDLRVAPGGTPSLARRRPHRSPGRRCRRLAEAAPADVVATARLAVTSLQMRGPELVRCGNSDRAAVRA